jgi:hypothetical protein
VANKTKYRRFFRGLGNQTRSQMQNKVLFVTMFLIMGVSLLAVSSCKDRRVAKTSEPFDPSIDGIAVRPLPPMDIELARLITQKGLAAIVAESAVPRDLAASDETTAADKNITEELTQSDPNS